MKRILYSLLAVLFLIASARSADTPAVVKPRDIVTRDHVTYHNATILGRNDHEIQIACDEGTIYIQLDNLPADLQKELGYMGPGMQEKADAEKAAQLKAQAAKDEADKKAKLESAKHEIQPGAEKHPYPELNPDFFPAELSMQIASYNTKAQLSNILAGGKHDPATDATLKTNADKLAALHIIYTNYKKLVENPPAGVDVATARKAVTDSNFKPYLGMPDVVLEVLMGVPDQVEDSTSDDKVAEKIYHYDKAAFRFRNGAYYDPALRPTM